MVLFSPANNLAARVYPWYQITPIKKACCVFPSFFPCAGLSFPFLCQTLLCSLDTDLSLRQSFPSLCWSLGRLLDGSSGLLHELQRPRNPIAGPYEPNRRSCWAVFSFDGSSATIACCMNCTVPVTSSPPASHVCRGVANYNRVEGEYSKVS